MRIGNSLWTALTTIWANVLLWSATRNHVFTLICERLRGRLVYAEVIGALNLIALGLDCAEIGWVLGVAHCDRRRLVRPSTKAAIQCHLC